MEQGRIPKSVGGSRPSVQARAEAAANNESIPFLAAKIYQSPSTRLDCGNDPRYPEKDPQVENIYFPSALAQDKKTRSGIVQALNWLLTGKME